MRVIGIGFTALILAAATPMSIACGSDAHGDHEGEIGALHLNLTGISNSQAHYRLTNAQFVVRGGTGGTDATLSSDTDPNAPSIKHELPAGGYIVTLVPGWRLEKETNGVFEPVNAVLASPDTQSFQIVDQFVTPVVFGFKAGEDVVRLGDGRLDISISIDDGMCPAGQTNCGGGCIDTSIDPLNCGACGNACAGGQACTSGVCTSSVFSFSGTLTGVQTSQLTGWSKCHDDAYGEAGKTLDTIQAECPLPRLLLGCSEAANPDVLIVAANALREDVLFDVGAAADATHIANGVAWYFNGSWSWGFAPLGMPVNRQACDVEVGFGEHRLCWHTFDNRLQNGWRCGTNTNLNGSEEFRRVIYQAP